MAASPATATTPSVPSEEELALYWDPRYHRYFYAGVMTPPTGQLYDFKGVAITRPTDTHTWSVVQLEQEGSVAPSSAPSSRSIIIERDEHGQRRRPSKGRRISWSALEVADSDTKTGSSEVRDQTKKKGSVFSWLRRILCVTVSLLVMVVATVLIWLEGSTEETARRTTGSSNLEAELSTQPGPMFQPFFRGPSSPAVSRFTARAEGHFMGAVADDPVTTAGSLYLDAASETSVSRGTDILSHICLVSGEPPQLEEMDCIENSSLRAWSRCRQCEAIVHCCYSLGKGLKLKKGDRARDVAENATQARPSELLGVLADDAARWRLATRKDRAKFARDAIYAMKGSKFDGVRLLAPWRERSTRGFYDFVVGLAADVAARFQKKNYSFGFFLPQGLSDPDRFTAQLKKILTAQHSVLFYPGFSVFWKSAAAVRWPLLQEALGHSSNETAPKSDSFACYLLAPPAPISLRLGERCDPLKSQSVAPEVPSTFLTVSNLCRLRNASWMTSVHKYSTYACEERRAVFYQSSSQAKSFAIDVLAQTPSSTCTGSISSYLEDGLHECGESSAEPGEA